MRLVEIENWARHVIDRVNAGAKVEDSRVELKANWTADPNKAARRIAGLCNANAGSEVLWIVGVHETNGPQAISSIDLAPWWAAVQSQFCEATPMLQDVAFKVGEFEVVALLFHTGHAPYLVRNAAFGQPGAGSVEREVPWREGTAIRSATRGELLRILLPTVEMPRLEPRSAEASAHLVKDNNLEKINLMVHGTYYAVLPMGSGLVLPSHRAEAWCIIGDACPRLAAKRLELLARTGGGWSSFGNSPPDTRLHTVHQGDQQVILDGPGFFNIDARMSLNIDARDIVSSTEEIEFGITLRAADGDASVTSTLSLKRDSKRNTSTRLASWHLRTSA